MLRGLHSRILAALAAVFIAALASGHATAFFTATHLAGFGAGSVAAPADISFTSNAASATTSLSYSFSSQNFGAAAADRYILIATAGQAGSAAAVSTVTIGGVSASEVFAASSATVTVAFWIAAVPTGTSGTVSISWAAQRARCAVIVWRVTGLQSTTAFDTGSEVNSGTAALNDTLDVAAGGFLVGAAYDGGTGSRTWTWSGVTEDVDTTFASGRSYTGGSLEYASAVTGQAISVTPSGSTTANVGLFISLR